MHKARTLSNNKRLETHRYAYTRKTKRHWRKKCKTKHIEAMHKNCEFCMPEKTTKKLNQNLKHHLRKMDCRSSSVKSIWFPGLVDWHLLARQVDCGCRSVRFGMAHNSRRSKFFFLHEQFLQRPLLLHEQHFGGIVEKFNDRLKAPIDVLACPNLDIRSRFRKSNKIESYPGEVTPKITRFIKSFFQ